MNERTEEDILREPLHKTRTLWKMVEGRLVFVLSVEEFMIEITKIPLHFVFSVCKEHRDMCYTKRHAEWSTLSYMKDRRNTRSDYSDLRAVPTKKFGTDETERDPAYWYILQILDQYQFKERIISELTVKSLVIFLLLINWTSQDLYLKFSSCGKKLNKRKSSGFKKFFIFPSPYSFA